MNTAPADESLGRLGRERLLTLLATVGRETGLDVRDAELMKFTNNAVFRLPHVGVVARIAGSRAVRQRVGKVVTVARWLAAHELPAVRLLPDLPQPLTMDGELATLWQEVPRVGSPPTGTELGRILRRIHSLAPPDDLPAWNPLDGIRTRLADAEELAEDDHAFLVAVCDELEAGLAVVEYALPPALVHGWNRIGSERLPASYRDDQPIPVIFGRCLSKHVILLDCQVMGWTETSGGPPMLGRRCMQLTC